jgi:hypothetical protein
VGTPEVYLPLSDPKHDRHFMRAVRDVRVLSLKQEPSGTKKDFGKVGYSPERFVSYLIFPKSLKRFEDQRVVGIKYDTLSEAAVFTPKARPSPRGRSMKPKPLPKPKPRPKRFTATVRLTATNDVRVTVEAMNEHAARHEAVMAAREQGDLSSSDVQTNLLRIAEASADK